VNDTGSWWTPSNELAILIFVAVVIISVVLWYLAGGLEYLLTRRAEKTGIALVPRLVSSWDHVHPLSLVRFRFELRNLSRETVRSAFRTGTLRTSPTRIHPQWVGRSCSDTLSS
jgi:hypothetical protein